MPPIVIDPNRLFQQLQNTGIAITNPAMYQFLRNLINTLVSINAAISGGSGSGGGANTTVIEQITNIFSSTLPDIDFDDSNRTLIPGPQGIQGIQGIMGPPGIDGHEPEEYYILMKLS